MKPSIAVITPYFREPLAMLEQAHQSVLAQDVEATVVHFMVADGFPQAAVNDWACRHVQLPKAHGDFGNTPRGVGSLLADVESFDFVAYLDADNWFQPSHLSSMLERHGATKCAVITCWRTLHRPDGSPLPVIDGEDQQMKHVDTSCYLFHRQAFPVLRVWTDMPAPLAIIGDRMLLAAVKHHHFAVSATRQRTVAYRTLYEAHYAGAQEPAPEGAKGNVMPEALKYLATPAGIRECVNRMGFWPA